MKTANLHFFLLLPLLASLLLVPVAQAGAFSPAELNTRGVKLMEKGDYAAALKPLRKANEALPYNSTVRKNLVGCYLGLAFSHLDGRRFPEAAEAFLEGRAFAGEDPRFWIYRGLALMRNGDYGEAEAELDEARAMTGDSFEVLKLLGRLYYDTGRLYEAVEIWEDALSEKPEEKELAALVEKTRAELLVEQDMATAYGTIFNISYDGEVHGDVGDLVVRILEEAYNEVGYNFDFYPEGEVPVLLYTRRDFSSLTRSPDWAGGLYDGKIRIPAGNLERSGAPLKALLYHEYTHVVVRFLGRGRTPLWLNEGLAEVEERRHQNPPLERLAKALAEGRLLPFEKLGKSFAGLSDGDVTLAYQQSYSFVDYLIENFGRYRVNDLLTGIGRGMSLAEALQETFGDYGADFGALQQQWRYSIEESLGAG